MSRGQYLERPALIPSGGEVLEGLWHRGTRTPPLHVLPPPPAAGSMDNVVCSELAWASARAGRPVLRFNFRGVGASQGTRGGDDAQLQDAAGALQLLGENTGESDLAVAAVGASAEIAARLVSEHPAVVGLVLVSPAPIILDGALDIPLLCIVGEDEPGRQALLAAMEVAGGRVEVVGGADARFQRNLPEVGRAAVRWLEGVGRRLEIG
ncbi:MAG TPA: alpha/beta hydrolase [Myxococcaceae bacterium]|nr:alpha/beta hydrolase [Myxococcaceae bacterium]